jgi:hypothetical protein
VTLKIGFTYIRLRHRHPTIASHLISAGTKLPETEIERRGL